MLSVVYNIVLFQLTGHSICLHNLQWNLYQHHNGLRTLTFPISSESSESACKPKTLLLYKAWLEDFFILFYSSYFSPRRLKLDTSPPLKLLRTTNMPRDSVIQVRWYGVHVLWHFTLFVMKISSSLLLATSSSKVEAPPLERESHDLTRIDGRLS